MIEPELAFAELSDVMDCAEDYVKYCLRYVMENNADDIEYLTQAEIFENKADPKKKGETPLKERLQTFIDTPFVRLSYTEAIETLE